MFELHLDPVGVLVFVSHVLLTASGLAAPHSRAKITLAKTATLNPSTIDNITTVTMPKEVKQKSGLIIGLNAGHSTSYRSLALALDSHDSLRLRKDQTEANMANRGHPQDPRSQDLEEEGFPVEAHCLRP